MALSHAFVVPAYGCSPHLEDCLRSLTAQVQRSPIVIATSTPFDGLSALAEKYGAGLHLHGPNRGIGPDWNAALDAVDCDLVTLAHQDDLYASAFAARTIQAFDGMPRVAFAFCDSDEVFADGRRRPLAWNHSVKRCLVAAATWPGSVVHGTLRRRLLLGFGNPLICASVTLNRRLLQEFRFREELKTNMDWLAWLELSEHHAVARIRKCLVSRRVHPASATSACLVDGARLDEDRMVFRQLWPRPIAHLISFAYRLSYSGYGG